VIHRKLRQHSTLLLPYIWLLKCLFVDGNVVTRYSKLCPYQLRNTDIKTEVFYLLRSQRLYADQRMSSWSRHDIVSYATSHIAMGWHQKSSNPSHSGILSNGMQLPFEFYSFATPTRTYIHNCTWIIDIAGGSALILSACNQYRQGGDSATSYCFHQRRSQT